MSLNLMLDILEITSSLPLLMFKVGPSKIPLYSSSVTLDTLNTSLTFSSKSECKIHKSPASSKQKFLKSKSFHSGSAKNALPRKKPAFFIS